MENFFQSKYFFETTKLNKNKEQKVQKENVQEPFTNTTHSTMLTIYKLYIFIRELSRAN